MTARCSKGAFERLVLEAVQQLGAHAYSTAIADAIEQRTGREVTRVAVYITLRRLERKGRLTTVAGTGKSGRACRVAHAACYSSAPL